MLLDFRFSVNVRDRVASNVRDADLLEYEENCELSEAIYYPIKREYGTNYVLSEDATLGELADLVFEELRTSLPTCGEAPVETVSPHGWRDMTEAIASPGYWAYEMLRSRLKGLLGT